MFVKKYSPKKLNEVVGQDFAIEKLKKAVNSNKAIMLYGPTGSGKTSAVYALANENNLEIIETNASDFRNKDQINSIIGSASQQLSLFNKTKLILVDEVDGLNGSDRGAVQALVKIIEESPFPIVLTTINPYETKLRPLRNKVELIEFKKLDNFAIYSLLKKICAKEKINYNEDILRELSLKANGDVRAAINDLQALKDNLNEITTGDREKKDSILIALKKIFKTQNAIEALNALSNTDLELDECFLWLDENLPLEYQGEDLYNAYNSLSLADIYRKRINKYQYYRFLVYQNIFMTAGIALSKKQINNKFNVYKPTTRILKIWKAKFTKAKKQAIAEKLSEHIHLSKKRIIKELPYMKYIFKNSKVIQEFELNQDEIDFLLQ